MQKECRSVRPSQISLSFSFFERPEEEEAWVRIRRRHCYARKAPQTGATSHDRLMQVGRRRPEAD